MYCGQVGGKYKWKTLEHSGIMFPPEYEEHNIPVIYKGEKVELYKDAEEAATLYARYTDTEYIKSKVFQKNFWKDWKKILGPNHVIEDLEGVDFSLIYEHLLKEKEKKKALTKEEKAKIKEEKDKAEEKYKTAIVDGQEQPVGNFRVEPPGIFIGRGCHPKLGRIKKRVKPSEVTINIGRDAPIPTTPDGSKWRKVIHDRSVEWLASWREHISGKIKYVWLGTKSTIKAESDREKYDLAKKLKRTIKRIREINYDNMTNPDEKIRQIATALYLIDNLALRVGNEKSKDEADTVGVTSIRIEHIKMLDKHAITLDFLGKDSIRYVRTVVVDPLVHKNINDFMMGKNKGDQLFDKINPSLLNQYLQSFMKNLTSKVFRTYNASSLFQRELRKVSKKFENYEEANKVNVLLNEFNRANMKVALLCNHQKKVSESFNKQIEVLNDRIKKLRTKKRKAKKKERKDKIQKQIKQLIAKRQLKIDMKSLSLGTSKTNYIDPRITVAFIKKHNIPADKVFSKALQEKFWWAFKVDEKYCF